MSVQTCSSHYFTRKLSAAKRAAAHPARRDQAHSPLWGVGLGVQGGHAASSPPGFADACSQPTGH